MLKKKKNHAFNVNLRSVTDIILYEFEDSIVGIGFPDVFLVRILSGKTLGTDGMDHMKIANIISESDFCRTNWIQTWNTQVVSPCR